MAFLLDTNVVSELRRPRPHGGVLAWLQSVDAADLHLASVTIGEIQAGIELSREQDSTKAAELEQWLNRVCDTFSVLPMDGPAFRCWARLMHRLSDTLYEDAMIAAIARVHQLTVVTRNLNDFRRFDVPLFDPFFVRHQLRDEAGL
ncbi:MAG: type II toxin-antitoxin system VapC family toxin [Cyanobium sp.]